MRRRILLADDSVTIQKVIELTFMDEDYEVRAVSNGDEAVALLPEAGTDFVIADVHMPGANGYEVCRRSKQLRPQVPVLLLVGTFEPFDENEARAAGADSFLKKPFDSQELLQRVQELLASKAAAPAAAAPAPVPAPPPAPAFPAMPAMDLPPMPAINAGPELPAEPSWGSFSLEPEAPPFPSMPEPFQAPPAPEPFDREPSFNLEPDPNYQLEAEPVFTLEEETPAYAIREDVFGAPDELSLEPQDRYLPEEPAAWPEPVVPAEPQPWAEPEPWSPQPEPWSPEPEPWSPQPEPAVFTPIPAQPAPAAAPVAAPEPAAATNGGGRLSDEDVDRIARRVAELLGDKAVRDVAWEVIPDMAEVIIRDRLRELESQVE